MTCAVLPQPRYCTGYALQPWWCSLPSNTDNQTQLPPCFRHRPSPTAPQLPPCFRHRPSPTAPQLPPCFRHRPRLATVSKGVVRAGRVLACWWGLLGSTRATFRSWAVVQGHEVMCKQTLGSSRSARPQDAHASEMRVTGTTAGTTRMTDHPGDPDGPGDHPNIQTARVF